MLELRTYTKDEIINILGTEDRQGIKRKLDGYGVEYIIDGWRDYTLTITAINDPFKLFCITILGIPAQADFNKVKTLYYHLFCCPEFATKPYEVMASVLKEEGEKDPPSSKTVSKWVAYLGKIDFVAFDREDCSYYAIQKRKGGLRNCTEISKETYCTGWHIYWEYKECEGTDAAYYRMFNYVGGHPCRKAKMKPNAIYLNEINQLIDILTDEYVK
ncbi:MAG: hypothetical protein IJ403_00680 [Oscillospiraceae bacterium]|nr:hypothetical protein [Oscillospiraceae bacterium]